MRQWDIWKGKPPGFERDHWFVILSTDERCASHKVQVNNQACYSLRGQPRPLDVRLNGADVFQSATVCAYDLAFVLQKAKLHSPVNDN